MKSMIVLYPHPMRGHLLSMLELAKLVAKHYPSLSITVVILNMSNHPFSAKFSSATLSGDNPSINFIHLPPVDDPSASPFELRRLNNPNLRQALLSLSETSVIKAFIADFFCSVSVQVSSGMNIPSYFFYTSSASVLCYFLYLYTIDKEIDRRERSLDEILSEIPATGTIRSGDVPSFMLDRSSEVYREIIETSNLMAESAGIIVNTFDFLEEKAVRALEEGDCTPHHSPPPPVFCIGPLLNACGDEEHHESLVWLHSQPSRSVVFLCFGSAGVFPASQLKEIAIGLENSGVRFLWSVRNPPEIDGEEADLEALLPAGFTERTRERGFLVTSWAPQRAILSHDSIGGFVTHCGWNSILEAICAGVPMVAWPLYAEQKMNRVYLVEDMKLGLPVTESEGGFVSAVELERRIIELMESEEGEKVRRRVLAARDAAAAAAADGGSSGVALQRFIGGLN